ncbi:glycosyltransferase family 4 protein [Flaviflexus massiliensis]|uniref:glycosyltransferase family 4 protein n=1 Tax=Flaviflexus massiliensis TaxID=1522309 RepID=UPI0006D59BBE|nr:glycosyltransferase family 4 protein [Flaviflexus massiliensis]
MKVALLAHDRFPIAAPFAGGLESFTWSLTVGLRRRGIEVVLFAGPGSDPHLEAEELAFTPPELSASARNDVAMPPAHQVQETTAYLQAMRYLAERRDIDVIHNNSLHYLPIVLGQIAPQPLVTTLHSPPTPWMEPALKLTPSARTVAVSQAVAEMWSHVTTATVIRNGVDLAEWRFGEGGDDLVWSGRIVPEKAPHIAAAIARTAGRRLVLAGPIIDGQYFASQVEPLLDERIRHVGHLANVDLQRLLAQSAACLVTPAWDEPFGLVAAEAMSCGTPVLGLARAGLLEVVRPGAGILVPPGTSDEMTVAAAVAVLDDVVQLDRRVVRAQAEHTLSLEDTVAAYVDLYGELVGR